MSAHQQALDGFVIQCVVATCQGRWFASTGTKEEMDGNGAERHASLP